MTSRPSMVVRAACASSRTRSCRYNPCDFSAVSSSPRNERGSLRIFFTFYFPLLTFHFLFQLRRPVAAELADLSGAFVDQPSADAVALVIQVVRPMQHRVRGARSHQGIPRRVG